MLTAPDFDFFHDRYPKRTRKSINKPDAGSFIEESEDEVLFQKPKLMSHCLYDIQEIVSSSEFNDDGEVVKSIDLKDFNIDYIKKNGLSTPLLFNISPEELGMTVPEAENFTVYDVMDLVGKSRKIEVVEVNEQKGRSMKLSDFITYYTSPPGFRNELLNVLSLEFSLTNLANCVSGPKFVSQIDWIDNIWPKELKERQVVHMQQSNGGQYSDFSTYPKVQRYCLMSVANCFTDFHIDFGGTSVWYHILKGKKIFWLIEPTEENILLYEEWILGGNNSESFFGRIVNKCIRVELHPGNTFIIPSGWIHCVYTPEDSLVFGGNFLHSYAVPMQTRVVRSEDRIKVGGKYRFPHFKQMIWYAIEDVVRKATNRTYLKPISVKAYLESQEITQREIVVGGQVQKVTSLEEAMSTFLGVDEAETDGSATDDQEEPSCSSAVQTGCKKSGQLVKDSYLSGMGMEESESEDEDTISSHLIGKEKEKEKEVEVPQLEDDPNVFYDNIPNGADGYYNLVPTQMKFGQKDYVRDFKPVDNYNQEFLDNVSPLELNGYSSLLEYAKKLIKSKRPEVGEGITRPRHLLMDFERLIQHLSRQDKLTISKVIDMSNKGGQKKARNVTIELRIVPKQMEFAFLSISLPKKKIKRKIAVKSEDLLAGKKTSKSTKKTTDTNHPQQPGPFMAGAPLPTQSADAADQAPNPYGFNPLDAAVALGKKPLPSAFRRSSNMATAPLPQKFKLKKLSEQPTPVGVKQESQPPMETDLIGRIMKEESSKSSQPRTKSFGSGNKSSIKQGNVQRLSMHSDDPDLEYKSPLQKLMAQQKKGQQPNQQAQPSENWKKPELPKTSNASSSSFSKLSFTTSRPSPSFTRPAQPERREKNFQNNSFSGFNHQYTPPPTTDNNQRQRSYSGWNKGDDRRDADTSWTPPVNPAARFNPSAKHFHGSTHMSPQIKDFNGVPPTENFNRLPPTGNFHAPYPGGNFQTPVSIRNFHMPPPTRDFQHPTPSYSHVTRPSRDIRVSAGYSHMPPSAIDLHVSLPVRDFPNPIPLRDLQNPPPSREIQQSTSTSNQQLKELTTPLGRNRRWDQKGAEQEAEASRIAPQLVISPQLAHSVQMSTFHSFMAAKMKEGEVAFHISPSPSKIPLPPNLAEKGADKEEDDMDLDMDVDEDGSSSPPPAGNAFQPWRGGQQHIYSGINNGNSSTISAQKKEAEEQEEEPQEESTIDARDALNEIGRLTRRMGGEEDEDLDMRSMYNLPPQPQYKNSNSSGNLSYHIQQQEALPVPAHITDACTAIDELFRLSQQMSNE